MHIPINGRIAIIDNNIEQALPLMQLFSRQQMPYVFYKGDDQRYLPEEGRAFNDIRVLFLDINLIDEGSPSAKQIKSTLYSVIKRVIAENNYPYLLVYWSRHDNVHGNIVEDLFRNELNKISPINFLSLQKSDYFELTNEKTAMYEEKIPELLQRIKNAVNTSPVYSYLMAWENLIHEAADNTLSEIFKAGINETSNWDNHSSYLFNKLGIGFSGSNFNNLIPQDKVKNSFYSLNFVFNDSLEYAISSKFELANVQEGKLSGPENPMSIYLINKKLLFADELADKVSPGIVSICSMTKYNFNILLHTAINRGKVLEEKRETICDKLKGIIDEKILKRVKRNTEKEILDELKERITKSMNYVEVNVTPICDFIQGKEEFTRFLPGLLVESKFKQYFDNKTEALFISPDFKLSIDTKIGKLDGVYFLLLDFRFFTSVHKSTLESFVIPVLRIRQQLLTEIQSKLSRHINRQGVLFLEA